MSDTSYEQGRARGHAAGQAGEPQSQPRKDLADADPGYQSYWAGVRDGHRAGAAQRAVREATGAA